MATDLATHEARCRIVGTLWLASPRCRIILAEPPSRSGAVGGIDLDPDRLYAQLRRGNQGRTGAHERVQHHVTWPHPGKLDAVSRQLHREWRRVEVSIRAALGGLVGKVQNIAAAVLIAVVAEPRWLIRIDPDLF